MTPNEGCLCQKEFHGGFQQGACSYHPGITAFSCSTRFDKEVSFRGMREHPPLAFLSLANPYSRNNLKKI